jgi:diaminopimelate epimerase
MNPMTEAQAEYPAGREAGESRLGYARVGVPHLVVLCDDVGAVDVIRRGRALRHLASLRDGANANFVSRDASGQWTMRTFERGVEDETLACGTGAVAVVGLLHAWGLAHGPTPVRTSSGRDLVSDISRDGRPPLLAGEGRIVFTGQLADLAVD